MQCVHGFQTHASDFLLSQEQVRELEAERKAAYANLLEAQEQDGKGAEQGGRDTKQDRERERQRRVRDREMAKQEAEAEKLEASKKRDRDEDPVPARSVHPLRAWRGLVGEARTEAKRQFQKRRDAAAQRYHNREREWAEKGMRLACQVARKAAGVQFSLKQKQNDQDESMQVQPEAGEQQATAAVAQEPKESIEAVQIGKGLQALTALQAKFPVVEGVTFRFCDKDRVRCLVLPCRVFLLLFCCLKFIFCFCLSDSFPLGATMEG